MPAINLENEVEEFQMVRQTIDTYAVCSKIWDYNFFSKGNELVLINMNSAWHYDKHEKHKTDK